MAQATARIRKRVAGGRESCSRIPRVGILLAPIDLDPSRVEDTKSERWLPEKPPWSNDPRITNREGGDFSNHSGESST